VSVGTVRVVSQLEDSEVRVAGLADLETVRALLEEASAWLRSRGIEQWPRSWGDEWIVPALGAGETWLVERDGRAIATVTVQWSDEATWGARPPDAGYVHRLAVRRGHPGLGRQLLEWAAAHAVSRRRSLLRLDCWSGNERLRAYYEAAGFTYCGDASESTWTVSRYERRLG
jgi:GNAT superfamily N-acetyltransferase